MSSSTETEKPLEERKDLAILSIGADDRGFVLIHWPDGRDGELEALSSLGRDTEIVGQLIVAISKLLPTIPENHARQLVEGFVDGMREGLEEAIAAQGDPRAQA